MKTGKGLLFLPSLHDVRLIEINNIDQIEASEFVSLYTNKLLNTSQRPVIDSNINMIADWNSLKGDNLAFHNDIVDAYNIGCAILHMSVLEEFKKLTNIVVNGKKGKRAVFVDFETTTIGIGTTVICKDICYINHIDPTVDDMLINIQSYIDNFKYHDNI